MIAPLGVVTPYQRVGDNIPGVTPSSLPGRLLLRPEDCITPNPTPALPCRRVYDRYGFCPSYPALQIDARSVCVCLMQNQAYECFAPAKQHIHLFVLNSL